MISEEELEKFDGIYKDEGEIDEFVKQCRKELKDPISFSFQEVNNNRTSQNTSKKSVNLNKIEDTTQLVKNIKNTAN